MCEQRAIFEDILNRIQNTIDSKIPKSDDCISLYDVAQLIIDKYNQYEDIRKSYSENLEADMEGKVRSIVVYDFNYEKNEMGIGISTEHFGDYKDIRFSKYNGDLFVSSSEESNDIEVMGKCGKTLSKMYDEFEALRGFNTQSNYKARTLNSKFLVHISKFGVEIKAGNRYVFDYDFELSLRSYKCEYECKCNSCNVMSTVQGNEEKIFKKTFVKIEDCPEWAQPILREIRQEQLNPKPKNFLEKKEKEPKLEKHKIRVEERTEKLMKNPKIRAKENPEQLKPYMPDNIVVLDRKPKVSSQDDSRPKSGIFSIIKEYFKDMYRLLNGEDI